jgi:hypothetical protein
VRLPKEIRVEGDFVFIKKSGNALGLGALLVTNSASEFRRIRGFSDEDWTG